LEPHAVSKTAKPQNRTKPHETARRKICGFQNRKLKICGFETANQNRTLKICGFKTANLRFLKPQNRKFFPDSKCI